MTSRAPTVDECRAVFEAAGQERSPEQVRALIILLWRAGLRSEEASKARFEDLQERRNGRKIIGCALRVPVGKGGKSRTVGISQQDYNHLRHARDGQGLILCTKTGREWQTSKMRKIVMRVVKRARCPVAFSPHKFRHAFAQQLVAEGARLDDIMHLMGHRSLHTTMIYLRSIGADASVSFGMRREEW